VAIELHVVPFSDRSSTYPVSVAESSQVRFTCVVDTAAALRPVGAATRVVVFFTALLAPSPEALNAITR
jgi:hypothetical protein